MNRLFAATALASFAGITQSAGTAPLLAKEETAYSAETLAMLDPTRTARAICGSSLGNDALRARLLLASALQDVTPEDAMPLYDNVPEFGLALSTDSEEARAYFDQGLMMLYGFNHAGAIRSFQQAQRLDPSCALCHWGEALAYGPNINAPMDAGTNDTALAAVARASALRDAASPLEQALIDAVAVRYSAEADSDRTALDIAYSDAMFGAAAAFPDNDEVAVLAAEAAMDTSPWDYWEADRTEPRPRIGDAIGLIETVMARNPGHPQAGHLYIHLMENNVDPRRAEAAADRLTQFIAPSAGHLVHMPAHIYYRIGRYADSIRSNIAATRADEAYLASAGDNGIYRYGYYPHNVHFIVTSAQMSGDMATAIREANRLSYVVSPDIAEQLAWVQPVNAAPYLAIAQFADPERVLEFDRSQTRLPYVEAMRLYARATAQAQLRDEAGFEREMAALTTLAEETDWSPMVDQGVPATDLVQIAQLVARGRYAYATNDLDEAIRLYRAAIEIERTLPYTEPPYWYYPISQSLGAAYYRAGRYDEARAAFRAALAQAPANGWALYGLARTERALGHDPEAAAAEAALERAWLGSPNWLRMDRI
ncbi:MAG: tetratricopeptide repeat protein [Parasphingopyxis sp.]|uniref:tetratricopeptide repeat protein n=1 Tax=Parasphingopyxis sp. TaxID=1920299 RepID=UPI003F9FE328